MLGSSKVRLHNSSSWRTLVPLGVLTGIFYAGYRIFSRQRGDIKLASKWQINMYRMLPLRTTSRIWGRFTELTLPSSIMRPMLRLYVWAFNCQMQEAVIEDLSEYRTIGEFFRRELKSGLRTIDEQHLITSPADGTVLHFGRVDNGSIEQVKGITFTLDRFLGPNTWSNGMYDKVTHLNGVTHPNGVTHSNGVPPTIHPHDSSANNSTDTIPPVPYQRIAAKQLTIGSDQAPSRDCDTTYHIPVRPGNELFFCTVYLAPGDYHRFHSPAQWTVHHRRHFPGDLLSVSPGIMRWIKGLFNYNERAIYYGSWLHGFFALAAIGATNVGSIKIYCDSDLVTNKPRLSSQATYYDRPMVGGDRVSLVKGQMFGEFNLGSSLVLIFEAPSSFDFNISQGCKVKVGEPLGTTQ